MKKCSKVLIFFLIVMHFILIPIVNATTIYWVQSYGGSKDDAITDIKLLSDGSIIAVGYTKSAGAGYSDVLVMKLSIAGEVEWSRVYGGSNDDGANAVAIMPNGDIIIAGYTYSFGAGGRDVWVLMLDSDGNVKWAKTYGGEQDDSANAIAITPDGGIIIAGWTESFGHNSRDIWILKLESSSGNIKWQKIYGSNVQKDEAYDVKTTTNGDIIVGGSYGNALWVLKLNSVGNLKWQNTYKSEYNGRNTVIAIDSVDNIIVTGHAYSTTKSGDIYAMKLSSNGNAQWQKIYNSINDDGANAVAIMPNGDIIIAGYTYSFGAGGRDVWVLMLDSDGNVKWAKTYGGEQDDSANAIAITPDGGIIIAGWTESFGHNSRDIWILKLPSSGQLYPCDFCGYSEIHGNIFSLMFSSFESSGTQSKNFPHTSNPETVNWTPLVYIQYSTFGILKISSEPSKAEVYVNGSYQGNTPLSIYLLPGTYSIKVTKEQYKEYITSTSLKTGELKNISVILSPYYGYLSINSSPPNAKVYIDGIYIGDTPIRDHKIPTGKHELAIKKEGYQDYTKIITIKSGKTTQIMAILSEARATLGVSSNPSKAAVYVNGSYKGVTPVTLELPPGTYDIKLTKRDYTNYTTKITLLAGETKSISVILQPVYGYLSIESYPSGSQVYVDESYIGTTPLNNYKLVPGKHTIKIKKESYQEYTKTVNIEAGKSLSISASLIALQPTPQTTASTLPSTTTTATVLRTTTTHSETVYTETKQPTASTGQTGWTNPTYLIAALISLIAVGGVAAKAKGGKSKPSPSQEVTAKPAPLLTKTPETRNLLMVKNFPPELLDKYEPLEFIGEGGFAKVFKVRRKSDGKIIALKVSRLDEKAKKFFLKEVKAWRLLDHPNIVKLYNAFDEPLPHLEIEFVDGIKLDGEVIRDLGKYPKPTDEETALALVRGIAEGLKHAHSKQVYHRDLKPQNVLITGDLTPKITDWGLAKVGAVSTTATTTKGLTLLYAAPEQLDDETYGHTDNRTDIYQLGLIFYELLTGKLPYQGTSPAVVMAKVINPAVKPKPPSHFDQTLAKYNGIFEKLLAKRKEDRYQSTEEFLRDLELMKKLDEERKALEKEIEKTKTTMSLTTDSKELKKLMRQLVEQLSRNALLHAQLNDKAGLINALEDLKAFSREHREELENAISQFEVMMRESVPISKSTLDELRVLLHKVQREVEER